MEVIDVFTISPFLLIEVMDARYSSTLSTFESAVYFYSLTVLSLVALSVLSNAVSIKVVNISPSLSTPESDQSYNHAAKIKSASRRRSSDIYQKFHRSRTIYHARTYLLLYRINLFTWVLVDLNWYIAYLTTIHLPLKYEGSFNDITSNFVDKDPNHLANIGLLRQSK